MYHEIYRLNLYIKIYLKTANIMIINKRSIKYNGMINPDKLSKIISLTLERISLLLGISSAK